MPVAAPRSEGRSFAGLRVFGRVLASLSERAQYPSLRWIDGFEIMRFQQRHPPHAPSSPSLEGQTMPKSCGVKGSHRPRIGGDDGLLRTLSVETVNTFGARVRPIDQGQRGSDRRRIDAKAYVSRARQRRDMRDCNNDGVSEGLPNASSNCGGCGRDCGGSACYEGRCAAQSIASGQPLSNFQVDEKSVYWTMRVPNVSYCMLMRADKNGAGSIVMHDSKVMNYQNCMPALTVDATHVFWGALGVNGILRSMPKGNANGQGLKELDVVAPNGIASDGGRVFFQAIDGSVISMSHDLVSYSTIAPANTTNSAQIVIDSNKAYVVKFEPNYASAHLLAIPRMGGSALDVMNGEKIYGLRIDDDGKLLFSTLKAVRAFDKGTQMKTDVVTGLGSASGFAVDAENVYFADNATGKVIQQPRGLAQPIVLAEGFKNTCTKTCTDGVDSWPCAQDDGPCEPHSIRRVEVDATHVYFMDDALGTTGRIWRVAKWRDAK